MVQNIITDLCHHLEIGIDGNLDIGNKRVIVGTPTITLTNNILTISCDTASANIYYTLDGSTPTSSSTKYTTAVTLNNSCTIKAIAIKGSKSSIVVSQDYIAILTAWEIVGNSEVHGNEIWSCGEYNPIDGKWHILVQPEGGSIADIALTEPLRKNNDAADTIEFPCETEGKALVTRNLGGAILSDLDWTLSSWSKFCLNSSLPIKSVSTGKVVPNILSEGFTTYSYDNLNANKYPYGCSFSSGNNNLCLYDDSFYEGTQMTQEFEDYIAGKKIIYELATPTTELVDAPQIQEADSYSMVISQGAKAVGWSSFTPNPS